MTSSIVKRKEEQLELAMEEGSQGRGELFSQWQLPYTALPEINMKDVDPSVILLGKKLKQPLIIASMTGGASHAIEINKNLAMAAEKCRVALGVGSQRAALENPKMRETFKVVRKYAPNTVIFANMGAVQLNYGRVLKDYREVIKMVGADALYLHLNPMQEAIQPEGDTNFKFLSSKIKFLIKNIGIPVFVKEVGCGLDEETVKELIEIGVAGIDVAGVGGTSWTWIEGKRARNEKLTEWFKDFGWRTDEVLPRVKEVMKDKILVASGGIRSPIQGLKAHLLGADLYSVARPFLIAALKGAEIVEKEVADWERGLKIAMFGIGAKNWKEAGKKRLINLGAMNDFIKTDSYQV